MENKQNDFNFTDAQVHSILAAYSAVKEKKETGVFLFDDSVLICNMDRVNFRTFTEIPLSEQQETKYLDKLFEIESFAKKIFDVIKGDINVS